MKSCMPEIVEPKQLIQSRFLVKRARLTVKRGAARRNRKSKPPQSPLRRAVRYRIRGAARHSTQDYQTLPLDPMHFHLRAVLLLVVGLMRRWGHGSALKKEMCCCSRISRSIWILNAYSLPGGPIHSECAAV